MDVLSYLKASTPVGLLVFARVVLQAVRSARSNPTTMNWASVQSLMLCLLYLSVQLHRMPQQGSDS